MSLKFGTDGWRAVIADEFTFENVRRMARAIHEVMPGGGAPVVVGHDTRFHAGSFARETALTLAQCGRNVVLSSSPCPTPAVSCQVVAQGSPFGIAITASHNPAEFCGVKIKTSRGASAGPEITALVERRLEGPPFAPIAGSAGSITTIPFVEEHRRRLLAMVDPGRIRSAGLKVVFDAMHGAAGRALEMFLHGGATSVETLHAEVDPLFGGVNPEPLEANLAALRERVRRGGVDIALATDGDGDRIGAFDEKGGFVTPLQISPLLALGLIKKGKRGPMCKTFANTILLDRIAKRHGLPFKVHPIGFKYIAEQMDQGEFMIGGEESGGIGVAGYLPERDGLLVSLLLLELLAVEGKPLSALLEEMSREYGALTYSRKDIPCPPERGRTLARSLRERPPSSVAGMKVTGIDDLDGVKLLLGEDGWILCRQSGTEPILRIYCEGPSAGAVRTAIEEVAAQVGAA